MDSSDDNTMAGTPKTTGSGPMTRRSRLNAYLASSKDPINSILLVLPLFVLYQVGILFTDGWKNGADFITGHLIALFGYNKGIYAGFNFLLIALGVGVFMKRRDAKGGLKPATFGFVALESTIYAFLLGWVAVRILLALRLPPPSVSMMAPAAVDGAISNPFDAIVLSLGAGTYEELVFRLLLMGGAFWVLAEKTSLGKTKSAVIAVIGSSLIFSAFHYVPIGMESWEMWSFSFRFLLGVFLAVIYVTRGFAVAVYTHAIYDILILVPRSLEM